ncbi:MAG TPA: HAD family hydrolase [Candidatus Bathyarchaeota archaeon]|nr:HAD family hydrolase [Candidatus Bathyarchaeota archaeon]
MTVLFSNLNMLCDVMWVFFDVGGVLIDVRGLFHYVAKGLGEKAGLDVQFLRERLLQHFRELKSGGVFKSVWELFYESFLLVAKEVKLDIDSAVELARLAADLHVEFFNKHARLYPDALPCLEALSRSGFKLGVISDADWEVLEREMERFKIDKYFEVIVTSSMVRKYKPDHRIFAEALKKAQCRPVESVYIGDSDVDLGSKQAGMIFILLDRGEKRVSEAVKSKADFIIHSLNTIPKILTRP